MGISTSTGTLIAGQSRTFNLSPASAVTLTLSPNVRVTITETPATVAATGLGGNASRVHEPRLPGSFTYGPYPMGGTVVVEVESNSGSSVGWVRSDSIVAESADGAQFLMDGGGNAVLPFTPPTVSAQIAPDDYAIQPVTLRTLALPNVYPAQPLHVVHPSLLAFPAGFAGYKYWLAYTPYPTAQADYENPCIVASNDLTTWAQPTTNPLADKPVGGYNADTHLFMSVDGLTMYLSYRERVIGAQNRVMVRSSTDGRNWTAARSIAAGTQGTQDYACQSIWWNGTGWTMISHNLDAASPWPVQRSVSTSADLFGGFGAPSTVTIAPGAGRAWWHTSFARLSSGQVVGLCQDNAISAGSAGNLYWAVSGDDGATFAVSAPISFSGGSRYRSCFAFEGATMHLLTGNGVTDIDYVQALPGRLDLLTNVRGQVAGQLAAAAVPGNALWADTCIRADSAVSAGVASSGGSYTVSSGTWGISSNQIYPVATGRLLASVGTPNHRVMAQFSSVTAAVQQWIIGRAVDGSNYWRCGIQTPTASGVQIVGLQVVIGGAVTDYPGVARCQIGDTIGLDFSGSRVRVLLNGQPVYEMQSAQFAATGTSIGLQANLGATTRYRNLVCTAN